VSSASIGHRSEWPVSLQVDRHAAIGKCVAVVEPHVSGHRSIWTHWISEQLAAKGWSVVVLTLQKSLDEPAGQWMRSAPEGVGVIAVPDDVENSLNHETRALFSLDLRYYRLLQRMLRAVLDRSRSVDVVFLPFGDYGLYSAAALGSPFGSIPWASVVMRPAFHYASMGIVAPRPSFAWVRRLAFQKYLRIRSLAACFTVDEPLFEFLRSRRVAAQKIQYLADPIDLNSAGPTQSRTFGIGLGQITVLVYGTLNRRKGVGCLLDAMTALARTDVHILCVGKQDADFSDALNSPVARRLSSTGRLHVQAGWADAQTEAAAFEVADIVWLGYRGHFQSSGVLVQAGRAGLPVIGCREGIIGWTVERHRCGKVVDVENPAAVAAAVDELAGSGELRTVLGENGRSAFSGHSVHAAGERISRALQAATLGRSVVDI